MKIVLMAYQTRRGLLTLFTALLLLPLLTIASIEDSVPDQVLSTSHDDFTDVVETKSGPVSGIKLKTGEGNLVEAYFGIPYAKPPVGELRFQPPRKVERWSATLNAVKPLPFCYQQIPNNFPFPPEVRAPAARPWSENCLTLNVWSPSPKPSKKAEVIVFIHGGSFIFGSSTWLIDGTVLAQEGIVVVTINYRLNVFGFFNLGHEQAPGNAGLMDQNLALQWIKDNIEAFGGNPESITLMGMSSGGASVGYHLLSPMSNGLFNRAVLMSGVPTNTWAFLEPEKSIKKANLLLESIGCLKGNTTLSLDCIRNKHPEDILEMCQPEDILLSEHFLPTVDGTFITEHPLASVESGKFNPGEVLVGSVGDEGSSFMTSSNEQLFKTQDGRLHRRDFKKVIKNSQRESPTDLQVEALNVVYTNWSRPDDPLMLRDAAMQLYGDGVFVCHTNHFADHIAKTGTPVYRYVHDFVPDLKILRKCQWEGATHASDQLPVTGPSELIHLLDEADAKVLKRFRSHIINFAKHGDPNLESEEFPNDPHWPQYNSGKQFNLFSRTSSIHKNYRARQCAAWLNFLPLLDGTHSC